MEKVDRLSQRKVLTSSVSSQDTNVPHFLVCRKHWRRNR
jgi:hypothetical protein